MLLGPYERVSLYVDQQLPKGGIVELVERHGLEDPIPVQFLRWIGKLVRGDLGWSKTGNRPVMGAILHFLPATIELAMWSVLPIIMLGIWFGILAALNHDRLVDHVLRLFSIVGWSFPTFVFALVVLMIFYAHLGWFPAGRLSVWADAEVFSSEFPSTPGSIPLTPC